MYTTFLKEVIALMQYKFPKGFEQLSYRIVETLFDEGMVFGADLENYIKDTIATTKYKFIDDNHYLLFEDKVLHLIEKRSTKYEVFDLKTRRSVLRNNVTEVKNLHKFSTKQIQESLKYNIYIKKRYRVRKVRVFEFEV